MIWNLYINIKDKISGMLIKTTLKGKAYLVFITIRRFSR